MAPSREKEWTPHAHNDTGEPSTEPTKVAPRRTGSRSLFLRRSGQRVKPISGDRGGGQWYPRVGTDSAGGGQPSAGDPEELGKPL